MSTVVTGFFRDMDRRLEEMKPKYWLLSWRINNKISTTVKEAVDNFSQMEWKYKSYVAFGLSACKSKKSLPYLRQTRLVQFHAGWKNIFLCQN